MTVQDRVLPGMPTFRLMATLSLAQLVSWGTLTYSFSLLIVPMERELGWSRDDLSGALSLGLLTAGLLSYPVGAWIDRYGGRLLMTLGSLLAAGLFVAWAQVQSLPAFYAIWIGLGVATAAGLYEPVFAVLTRLFPVSFRAKITAVTLTGGFASTVFIPLTQWLVSQCGWRGALLWLAGVIALVCVPAHALALRGEAPAPKAGHQPQSDRRLVRKAMGTRAFWGLALCFTAYYVTFSAMTYHMVPLLTELGHAPMTTVAALSLIGPAQVAGRALLLALPRRPPIHLLGPAVAGLYTLSILILAAQVPGSWVVFAFALMFGAANGIMTILRGTAVPDLLWREGYGAINGALGLPTMLAKAAAPFAASLVWSLGQGYGPVLWAVAGGGLLALAGMLFATRK